MEDCLELQRGQVKKRNKEIMEIVIAVNREVTNNK